MRKIVVIILIVLCCLFTSRAKPNVADPLNQKDNNTQQEEISLVSEAGIESIFITAPNSGDISNSSHYTVEYYFPIDRDHIESILEYLNSFFILESEQPRPFLESTATKFEIIYNNGETIYLRSINDYVCVKSATDERWYKIAEGGVLPCDFVKTLKRPSWDEAQKDTVDISGNKISVNFENGKIKFPDKQIKYISVRYSSGSGNGTEIKYWNKADCDNIKKALETIDLGSGQEIKPYINLGGTIPKIYVVFEDNTYMGMSVLGNEFHFENKSYSIQCAEQLAALRELLYFCEHK